MLMMCTFDNIYLDWLVIELKIIEFNWYKTLILMIKTADISFILDIILTIYLLYSSW